MFAELDLSGSYRETAGQVKSLLRHSQGESFIFDVFYRRCATIRKVAAVKHVLVHSHPSFHTATVAALEEIRTELRRLVEAGKEVVFYASEYRDAQLFLASACTRRVMHPLGTLRCTGLARTNLFFRRLSDRFGVEIQIARRGKYKSATDMFRLEKIDPSNLEQYQAWLDAAAERLHAAIAEGYRFDPSRLEPLLEGALLDGPASLEAGWIDELASVESLRTVWRAQRQRPRKVRTPERIGRGARLAVLHFEGAIVEGKSRLNPILGQSIGSSMFVKQVDALGKDRRVKAVVLRVNSGGGSAVASEDIRLALTKLAERKPLVVSMSEVAGSGGYWISTAGSTVFALATTLTGSIGVISLAANFGDALARHGITHSTIRTHEHADAGSGYRSLTASEFAELDRQVAAVYDRFLELVASTRHLTVPEVDDRAQGRIWSGRDALEQSLVDRVGGLADAIDEAQRLAGLTRSRVQFGPRLKYSFLERLIFSSGTRGMAGITELARLSGTGRRAESVSPAAIGALAHLAHRPLLLDPTGLFDTDLVNLLDADVEIE